MKKTAAVIAAVATIVLLFGGCQPTPTEEYTMKKDTERMLDQAGITEDGTAISDIGIPNGKYVYEAADTSGRLHIKADAKIIVPAVEKLPVARVSRGRFTIRDLENLSRILGVGGIPVSQDTSFPKEYYLPQLNQLMEMRQNGKLDKYSSVEELDKAIRELMEKVAQAPEVARATEHDLSFTSMEGGGETASLRWIRNNAVLASLSVVNNEQGAGGNAKYIRDVTLRAEFSTLTAQGLSVTLNYEQIRNPNFKKPAISETDAMNIAQAAIDGLDLKDFVCTGKRMAALYNSTIAAEDGERQGLYEFMFTRSVNGTAITYTNEDMSADPGRIDVAAKPWLYEKIRIFIDDEGIFALVWNAPHVLEEVEYKAVSLLPFEKIRGIFESMIVVKNKQVEDGTLLRDKNITVTAVRLGLMRIIEKDNNDTAYLVPVWDFFGTYDSDGGTLVIGEDGYESLLTINAVDGSVIDRTLGY